MRAICGAVITAGALIGLGLTAVGIGMRYQLYMDREEVGSSTLRYVSLKHLDTPMLIVLTTLVIAALIGLGIAFVGLAYHHHRRHHEMLHLHGGTLPPSEHRVPV